MAEAEWLRDGAHMETHPRWREIAIGQFGLIASRYFVIAVIALAALDGSSATIVCVGPWGTRLCSFVLALFAPLLCRCHHENDPRQLKAISGATTGDGENRVSWGKWLVSCRRESRNSWNWRSERVCARSAWICPPRSRRKSWAWSYGAESPLWRMESSRYRMIFLLNSQKLTTALTIPLAVAPLPSLSPSPPSHTRGVYLRALALHTAFISSPILSSPLSHDRCLMSRFIHVETRPLSPLGSSTVHLDENVCGGSTHHAAVSAIFLQVAKIKWER